jgi:ubiquitin-protein ligase
MDEQLSIISQPGLRRRIAREIEILINNDLCRQDTISITKYTELDDNNKNYKFEFNNIRDNKHYCFYIPKYYPFKPPKMTINNKPIGFYHKVNSNEFRDNLKKYTGIECFCCETILCPHNWGPVCTIKDIIFDIQKFANATHQIIIRIIVDVIKRKFLNTDIPIIEWLY